MIWSMLIASQALAACPVEDAIYAPRFEDEDGADIRVDFVALEYPVSPWSDVQMRVTAAPLGDPIWLTIVTGNGYSIPTAIVTARGPRTPEAANDWQMPDSADPLDQSDVFAFNRSFDAITEVPMAGDPAPDHLFLPGLGPMLWYGQPRIVLPPVMFDRVACQPDAD